MNTSTPETWNSVCARATRLASRRVFRLASTAVTEVPMLAPSTSAMAPGRVSSPWEASTMRIPVNALLLCMSAVSAAPSTIPSGGHSSATMSPTNGA